MGKRETTEKEARNETPAGLPKHGHVHSSLGALAGEIAGAIVGGVAGPAGAVAGMILGAVAGEVATDAFEWESERSRRHEASLDQEIGVIGGDLGAASADAPPARIGAPSAASLGVGGSYGHTPAEGPIQDVDD
jgi:hypothetical protein